MKRLISLQPATVLSFLSRLFLSVCCLLTAAHTAADITSLQGSASPSALAPDRDQTVAIVWSGAATGGESSAPLTVDRAELVDQTGSVLLASRRGPVVGGISTTPTVAGFDFTFSETLAVTADLLQRALQRGNQMTYRRTFSQGASIVTAQITLTINTMLPGTAAFSLDTIDLRFDNQRTIEVIPVGQALSAYARLRGQGAGLVQIEWALADPASTAATPVFRTLSNDRRYIARRSGQLIQAPPLPSHTSGWYLLRLSVQPDAGAVVSRTIQYYVAGERSRVGTVQNIEIGVDEAGLINWTRLVSAQVYKVEVYAEPQALVHATDVFIEERVIGSEPSTQTRPEFAVYLPGHEHALAISEVRSAGQPIHTPVRFRVLAYDENGVLVGVSALSRATQH